MFYPGDLVRFALAEFERGVEGVSPEEALVRLKKADGTQMNAISWTIGHISAHWLTTMAYAKQESAGPQFRRWFGPNADPTPLPLHEARRMLAEARQATEWFATADDSVFSYKREGRPESAGTGLMRVILHTWFHIGEINAICQMLGHREVPFVGQMTGRMEWRP